MKRAFLSSFAAVLVLTAATAAHASTQSEATFATMVESYNAEHGISRWMEMDELDVTGNSAVATADSCAGEYVFTFERHCSRSSWRIVDVEPRD